jgi:eukaryotic-like serine/threonine-protein kinase
MNLEIGSKIGDYEIIDVLGAGGMGKVFKVRNIISGAVEAMKVLLPNLQHEPELADRFVREIKVQASLQHPNITAFHTALRVDNQILMLMELVEGDTLECTGDRFHYAMPWITLARYWMGSVMPTIVASFIVT